MEKQETLNIKSLKDRLREFAKERDWEKFHSPKNLVMAMTKEAAELLEIFQWMTEEESVKSYKLPKVKQNIEDEIADVLTYLIRLSDLLDIDLEQAITNKIEKNTLKYPTHLSKGNSKKYTELSE